MPRPKSTAGAEHSALPCSLVARLLGWIGVGDGGDVPARPGLHGCPGLGACLVACFGAVKVERCGELEVLVAVFPADVELDRHSVDHHVATVLDVAYTCLCAGRHGHDDFQGALFAW